MNGMNEDLTDRFVVMREDAMAPEYRALHWRIVLANGGFGCRAYTNGSAVFGEVIADGEQARFRGEWFFREATPDEVAIAYAFRLDNEAKS